MKPPIYNYTKKTKMVVLTIDDFAAFIKVKLPTAYSLNMATVELRMNGASYIGINLEDMIFLPEQAGLTATAKTMGEADGTGTDGITSKIVN